MFASTTYHYRVKSKDSANNLATAQDFTFRTSPPPLISLSPTTLPDAIVGIAYSQTITASGGFAPYTFSVVMGSLPAGLSLGASTGAISGTPTTPGSSSFMIRALDSMGYPQNLAYTVNTTNVVSDNVTLGFTGRDYGKQAH